MPTCACLLEGTAGNRAEVRSPQTPETFRLGRGLTVQIYGHTHSLWGYDVCDRISHSMRGSPQMQMCPKPRAHDDGPTKMPYKDFYLSIAEHSLHTENTPWATVLTIQIDGRLNGLLSHWVTLTMNTEKACVLWPELILLKDLTVEGRLMLITWEASICNETTALTITLGGPRDQMSHRESGVMRWHPQCEPRSMYMEDPQVRDNRDRIEMALLLEKESWSSNQGVVYWKTQHISDWDF